MSIYTLCEDTRKTVAEWLERSELTEGYLFRRMTARGDNLYVNKDTGEPSALTADGVRKIIKSCAARVRLTEKVSGHSARIGSAVSQAQAGASLVDIQTGVAGKIRVCQRTTHAPSSLSVMRSQDLRKGSGEKFKIVFVFRVFFKGYTLPFFCPVSLRVVWRSPRL